MRLFSTKLPAIVCLAYTLLLCACSTFVSAPSSAPAPALVKPKNIALLVPLEGPNGSSGQAIRNGFLAAYYYAKQTMNDAPGISVIDTSNGNIVALYQQAIAKGADFIVGPLTKPELQTLASQDRLAVATLALNTLDNPNKAIANLYQFGLSPQDEAEQAAVRAKHDGYSRALIIVPDGNWGTAVANAFQQKWQQLGGAVAGHWAYSAKGNMADMVQKALNNAQSNQGMDVVFLAATPSYARQIKPLLTFYGSSSLPVYATSVVYSGIPSLQDHDLEGIVFADMPWIIGNDTPAWSQIRASIQSLWGTSYNRTPRLYALGIDAYHLTYTFNQLTSTLAGTTGQLSLDHTQRIHRSLEWAKFQNGAAQPLP